MKNGYLHQNKIVSVIPKCICQNTGGTGTFLMITHKPVSWAFEESFNCFIYLFDMKYIYHQNNQSNQSHQRQQSHNLPYEPSQSDVHLICLVECRAVKCCDLKRVWDDLKTLHECISWVKTRWIPDFYPNLF